MSGTGRIHLGRREGRYVPLAVEVTDDYLYLRQCVECGALVVATGDHDDWHKMLTIELTPDTYDG